jgi:hypothetical protein
MQVIQLSLFLQTVRPELKPNTQSKPEINNPLSLSQSEFKV